MELIVALRKIRACEGETAAQLVLEYAIAEAVAAEREACAKVCDWERSTPERGTVARYLGERIRERSNDGGKRVDD